MSPPHTYYFQRETVFINIIIIIPFYYSLPSAHYFCPPQDLPFLKQSVDTSPSSDIIVLMQLFPLSAWLPSFLFPSVQVLIGTFHLSKNVDLNVFIDLLFITQQHSVDSIFNVNENICLRMRALPVSWLYLCALTKWMTQIVLVGLKPAFSLSVFIESPPLTIKVNLEARCRRSDFVSQSLVPGSRGLGLTVAETRASGSCSFSTPLPCRWCPPVPPPWRPSLYSSPLLPHPTCSQEIFNK